MSLSENVFKLRTLHGYSQRELAKVSKVSAVHVSTIERGNATNVGLSTLIQLAEVFNITVSELIGEVAVQPITQVSKVTDFVYSNANIDNYTPDELHLIQLANQLALAKIQQDRNN